MRRGKFNLGSFKNLTCDMGYLIPIQVQDVMAGDSFRGASQVFMRMTPLLAPIMHPIYISVSHFFVPYRLIWEDFEEFITKNNENLQVPKVKLTKNVVGSLFDYLGIPPFQAHPDPDQTEQHMLFNALPLRAYQLIWNRYYRDQDLQEEIEIDVSTTLNDLTPANLQKVCWHKDYFTISRPWEQKGEEVSIPLYTFPSAPASYQVYKVHSSPRNTYRGCLKNTSQTPYTWLPASSISVDLSNFVNSGPNSVIFADTKLTYTGDALSCGNFPQTGANNWEYQIESVTTSQTEVPYDAKLTHTLIDANNGTYRVEGTITFSVSTSSSGYLNVSDIRMGIAQQRLRERKAKFGSQYRDLLASLGVNYKDSRLQEPEFITGSSSVFRTSEIIQTAGAGNDPVGSLRGYGIGYNRTNGFKRYFAEHGIFMTCMFVRPLNMYSDGVPRMFLKENADDFIQQEVAQLVPMQEVYKSELSVEAGWRDSQNQLLDPGFFGYIDRYEEFRYTQSSVSGEFRTFYKDWHLARMFDGTPVLNSDFLTCNPSKRIFAEQTQHSLIIMAQNMLRARRILPQFAKTGAL